MLRSSEPLKPEIVCILGMHRSGTSLLTRMLNLMGIYLGPEQLLMRPNAFNPKGYWEHDQIVSLNDEILKRLGGSWEEPPTFPPGWENDPILDDLKQRARTLIQDSFNNVEAWGWKDPRSCLTLRFWQQLVPEMRYVVCIRNPVDVAYSLEDRDRFPAEKSSDLWFTYVSSALQHSEGKPRLVIFYEDLMDDCFGELQRLGDFLGKPELAKQADIKVAVQEFIEKGLEHSRASMLRSTASHRIALRTKALYLSQRISVSLGREQINMQHPDQQIEKALFVLGQFSFEASGQTDPLVEELAQFEDQLTEGRTTIRSLGARLTERDKQVAKISAELAKNEEKLKVLSTQLIEKDGTVQTLTTGLAEKDGTVQTLTTRLAERDGIVQALTTALAERDGIVQTLTTRLAERDETVQRLTAEAVEQSREQRSQAERAAEEAGALSAQLLDSEAQLKKIKDSLGWRVLTRYGQIKYRYLLPIYGLLGQTPTAQNETKLSHSPSEERILIDD